MTYVVKTSSIFFELGQVHGAGLDSQIKAGMQAALWVKQGLLVHKQARDVYSDWKAGSDSEAVYSDALDASKAVISIFGTFMLPNVLKHGDVHERALKVRAKCKAEGLTLAQSAYNMLAKINREQNKASALLTEAQIRGFIVKAEKAEGEDASEDEAEAEEEAGAEKTLAERLGELAAMARKIQDKFQPDGFDVLVRAIDAYASPSAPSSVLIPQVNREAVTLQ
jgi:hypothetical protein